MIAYTRHLILIFLQFLCPVRIHPVQVNNDGDLECLTVKYHSVTTREKIKYSFRANSLGACVSK